MQPITEPMANKDHPIEVLAQTVASHSGWQLEAGQVFDSRGVFLAPSLTELAEIMLAKGWIHLNARASGVNWRALPHQGADVDPPELVAQVHAAMRQAQATARGLA